jgi:hypothetical protein
MGRRASSWPCAATRWTWPTSGCAEAFPFHSYYHCSWVKYSSLQRVATATAREYADQIGAAFFEMSARSAQNVSAVFEELARSLPPPPVSTIVHCGIRG